MIELKNINGGYGKKQVLFDINTIMHENEITSIIGPNGCGKSTLLQLLSGNLSPDTGTVEIGDTVKIGNERKRQGKKNIGIVPTEKSRCAYCKSAGLSWEVSLSGISEKIQR